MLSNRQTQMLNLVKNRDEVINNFTEQFDVNYGRAVEMILFCIDGMCDVSTSQQDDYVQLHVPSPTGYIYINLDKPTNEIINRSIH